MLVCVLIALITIALMVCSVLLKPYIKIGKKEVGLYWIICLIGAIFMLVFGCISFDSVISGITANTSVNPLKILTLFLSMTLLSVYLGDAGFFDYIADSVFLKCKGGTFVFGCAIRDEKIWNGFNGIYVRKTMGAVVVSRDYCRR